MRISDWSSDVCSSDLLVTLLLGLVCYGQYFLIAHSVQQIANDAARATIGGLTSDERSRLAVDAADAAAAFNPEIDVEAMQEIGRAHVCTPVSNAHLVCGLLLEK